MAEPADSIYEEIQSESDVQKFMSDFEGEKLHLDFKGKVPNVLADGLDGFKASLAKALSGFSNADGGVLVLGVRENKKEKRFELEPYAEPATVRGKVIESISRITSPPVPKVQAKVVPSNRDSAQGYIVVLIPKSEVAPHQSVRDYVYYQRSGESHKPMLHFQISDLFGRRPQADLRPVIKFIEDPNKKDALCVHVLLQNLGSGLAKYPYIAIEDFSPVQKEQHFTSWFQADLHHRRQGVAVYSGGPDKVIHPSVAYPVMAYFMPLASIEQLLQTNRPLLLKAEIGAEGTATRKFEIEVPIEILIRYRDESSFMPEPFVAKSGLFADILVR